MFCKHCGKEISDTAQFCKFCGNQVKTNATSSSTQSKIHYGRFWPRAGAYIVDQALLLLSLLVIGIFIGYWGEAWDSIIGYVGFAVYSTFFLWRYSTTPGKKLFGLRVVSAVTNDKLTFGKAVGRTLSYWISWLALGFGIWQVAFDRQKHRGWHDHLAGTVVLQEPHNRKRAIWLTVLAAIFYFGIVLYGYAGEEEVSP